MTAALAVEPSESPAGEPLTLERLGRLVADEPAFRGASFNAILLALYRLAPKRAEDHRADAGEGVVILWGVPKEPANPIHGPQFAVANVAEAKKFLSAAGFYRHTRRRADDPRLVASWRIS